MSSSLDPPPSDAPPGINLSGQVRLDVAGDIVGCDKNAQFPPWVVYIQHFFRKRIETMGSLLERLLPIFIHTVTAAGFKLKVVLFVLAVSINCLSGSNLRNHSYTLTRVN